MGRPRKQQSEWYVATTDATMDIDGKRVTVQAQKTRVRGDSKAYRQAPHLWEPITMRELGDDSPGE